MTFKAFSAISPLSWNVSNLYSTQRSDRAFNDVVGALSDSYISYHVSVELAVILNSEFFHPRRRRITSIRCHTKYIRAHYSLLRANENLQRLSYEKYFRDSNWKGRSESELETQEGENRYKPIFIFGVEFPRFDNEIRNKFCPPSQIRNDKYSSLITQAVGGDFSFLTTRVGKIYRGNMKTFFQDDSS